MGLSYNPNNENIFDVTNEKTDHRTDYRTDFNEKPKEAYQAWVKVGCLIGAFGSCWVHRYGWRTRYRIDKEKQKLNKQKNKDNRKRNEDNKVLNAKNVKRNKAY